MNLTQALNVQTLFQILVMRSAHHVRELGLYRDSARRKAMRTLLESTADLDVPVTVEYFKADFTPRVMTCKVKPDADGTYRYVTVWDLEAEGYRRICLDHVVRVTVNCITAAN